MRSDLTVVDCDFDNAEQRCPRCRFKARDRSWKMNCPLGSGLPVPGTRLMLILTEMGITKNGCKCPEYARKMNAWGVDKCRERKAEIVAHLVKQSKAESTELPFGLDLADLLGELVDEAIRLADSSAAERLLLQSEGE